MPTPSRLYLDHASTSWPKAEGVIEAMSAFMTNDGASASRGNYASARRSVELVERMRRRLANRITASDVSSVSIHGGATAALNAAIHGMIPPIRHRRGAAGIIHAGDVVLATAAEHNAVLRPLHQATSLAGATLRIVPTDEHGLVIVEALVDMIDDATRLIAVTHASNVTGAVQPLSSIAATVADLNRTRSSDRRLILLCDAAQTFGVLPIDVSEWGIDVLAAPAHKGCGGPAGIAMLYVAPRWHESLQPAIQGGTGHGGDWQAMPTAMPMKLEAGTLNLAALAGWEAALDTLDREDAESPGRRARTLSALSTQLHESLNQLPGVRVIGRPGPLPVVSLDFGPQLAPEEVAAILDLEFGIEVRAGHHCAGRLHDELNTAERGTLRISAGPTTTPDQIAHLAAAISELLVTEPTKTRKG